MDIQAARKINDVAHMLHVGRLMSITYKSIAHAIF